MWLWQKCSEILQAVKLQKKESFKLFLLCSPRRFGQSHCSVLQSQWCSGARLMALSPHTWKSLQPTKLQWRLQTVVERLSSNERFACLSNQDAPISPFHRASRVRVLSDAGRPRHIHKCQTASICCSVIWLLSCLC